jgi:phosphoribosylanthranilate isomerase
MTRVKVCGITSVGDAALAVEAGVDAIGLNFVGGPRRIEVELARQIVRGMPPMVEVVGLAQGHEAEELHQRLPVHTFQIYGELAWTFYENEIAYWTVRHVESRAALTELAVEWGIEASKAGTMPQAILLDAAAGKALGGTGKTFDWGWIAEAREAGELVGLPPIVLAGGLTPENVAEAVRVARPYAVDVSSGVEVAGRPGVKDAVKMRDFVQAVRGAG